MKILLDAMGGDNAPEATIKGAVNAINKVSAEYLYLYPPGIPLMVPGEVIQMKQIKKIKDSLRQGLDVHGAYFKAERAVTVLSTENKRRECL